MKATKHILTMMLALLMILSSTGLTLAAHFCKGELKEMAFFMQEQNCCPPKAHSTDCGDCSEKNHAGDCCENLSFCAELSEAADVGFRLENLQPVQYDLTFTVAYLAALLKPEAAPENTIFAHYPPPVTERDIPVLVQSFLL